MNWEDRTILNYETYGLATLNRFWCKVEKPPNQNGCWEWKGCLNNNTKKGYGIFCYKHDQLITAHRFSWILANGMPNKKMEIMHKCDNKICVNPAHLCEGTHKDNLHDASVKKLFPLGIKNHACKLTEKQVIEIRQKYAEGKITQRELGLQYGLTQGPIGMLIRRETWAWLK